MGEGAELGWSGQLQIFKLISRALGFGERRGWGEYWAGPACSVIDL